MSSSGRQYEVVLYGATGYTGKLTASYMATHLPTDIKWAISGRSESKLEAVAATCRKLSPDRVQPGMEKFISFSLFVSFDVTFPSHDSSQKSKQILVHACGISLLY